MKSPYTFYNRYINGIQSEDVLNADYPLTGESPFESGTIQITEEGQFTCSGSNKSGSPAAFLQELYGMLKEEGIDQAIEDESSDQPQLRDNLCQSQLDRFREDESRKEDLERRWGIELSIWEEFPLWMDQDGRKWHYIYCSPIGYPVCRYSWEQDSRRVEIVGVPRPRLVESEKILFVETPLQKEYLQYVLDLPVYIRPTPDMLRWIDYEKLIQGKTVVILKTDEEGTWETSFHPFLKYLQQIDKPLKSIDATLLTGGKSLTRWLSEDEERHVAQLKEVVEETRLNQGTAFDRATYESFISDEQSTALYFPLDVKRGLFWYGTAEGSFVHSCPLNILSGKKLKSLYNLDNKISKDTGIRLSKKDILNVASSGSGHSPFSTFDSLRNLMNDHIYFAHDSLPTLVALWVMGGYVFKLFNAYPYLHVRGRKGTGKTTMLEIITSCGFNGLLESQATRASVIQQIDRLGCTLCLDEFESHSKGTGNQYVQMINAGYKQSGTYRKMSGTTSTTYNVYCPKVLASIDPIEIPALRSRTIPIRSKEKPTSVHLTPWDPGRSEILLRVNFIRRGCYALGLYHHEAIQRNHRLIPSVIELPSRINLEARQHELVSPLLAIAWLVDRNRDSNVEEDLLKAIQFCWHPGLEQQQRREQLLAEELVKWNDSPSFKEKREYRSYKGKIAINNECWEGTPLAKELGGKDQVLTWLLKEWNLKKEAVHMSAYDTNKSCTLFPTDLKIADKKFSEWFRGEES